MLLEVRPQAKRKIKEPSESVRATSLETALSLPHLTSFKVWVGCGSNQGTTLQRRSGGLCNPTISILERRLLSY